MLESHLKTFFDLSSRVLCTTLQSRVRLVQDQLPQNAEAKDARIRENALEPPRWSLKGTHP